MSIVAEVGDLSRFSNAKAFSNYIGLCPGEDSSGLRVRHTAITKAGNSRVRQLSMERKGLHYNVITTAAARELSCFIWGMMTGNISRTSI